MRRRVREPAPGVAVPPPELLAYDPADWLGVDCHPQCAYWAALDEWTRVHGPDAWPDVVADGPDVPWQCDAEGPFV